MAVQIDENSQYLFTHLNKVNKPQPRGNKGNIGNKGNKGNKVMNQNKVLKLPLSTLKYLMYPKVP